MTDELEQLLARTQIQATITRYALSVDQRDWASLQSLFTTEIERDVSSFTGQPPESIPSQQHVAECQATLPGFDSTQHFLLNQDITLEGDQATAIAYMMADHTLTVDGAQKQFTIRGYYTYQLVRSAGEWKISALALQVQSTHGEMSLFEIAAKRAAEKS